MRTAREPDRPVAEDAPLDAGAMLALLKNQRRSVQGQLGGFLPLISVTWGVGWLVAFGALWLIDGLRPAASLPIPAAVAVFISAMVGALAISIWLGMRGGRGIRSNGSSTLVGVVYGSAWAVASVAIGLVGVGLVRQGMPAKVANYFFPTVYVLFAGVMYMVSGAIWRTTSAAVSGAVLVVIAAAAPFISYPLHYLFFALAGGGTFLVLALVSQLHRRRMRAATEGTRRG